MCEAKMHKGIQTDNTDIKMSVKINSGDHAKRGK